MLACRCRSARMRLVRQSERSRASSSSPSASLRTYARAASRQPRNTPVPEVPRRDKHVNRPPSIQEELCSILFNRSACDRRHDADCVAVGGRGHRCAVVLRRPRLVRGGQQHRGVAPPLEAHHRRNDVDAAPHDERHLRQEGQEGEGQPGRRRAEALLRGPGALVRSARLVLRSSCSRLQRAAKCRWWCRWLRCGCGRCCQH